jgi:hypothetical protein
MNFMLKGVIQLNTLPFPLCRSAMGSFPATFACVIKGK